MTEPVNESIQVIFNYIVIVHYVIMYNKKREPIATKNQVNFCDRRHAYRCNNFFVCLLFIIPTFKVYIPIVYKYNYIFNVH